MKNIFIFALVALFVLPYLSLAATPQLVSVHGKLTDTLNNPYSGSKNFIFRIYSQQSGGSPLYTEFWNASSQQVSLAYGGYFSVLLGSQTALALPFDQQYWLEITVEGETLSPRYKLGSTPYSYRSNITENLAANANASGNLYVSGNVGIGTSSPANKLNVEGAGNAFNVSNGASCSYVAAGSTAFTACSSRDIKGNITPFAADGILEKIASVPVNTYDFRNCASDSCRNRLGLVAEDFQKVLNRGDGKTVDGQDVQMALWLGVQQLTKQNEQLQTQNQNLQAQNANLAAMVGRMCANGPALCA